MILSKTARGDEMKISKSAGARRGYEEEFTGKKTILFVSASPVDAKPLRLGEELRQIREKIRLGKLRESFIFEVSTATRPGDLVQALLDVRPCIVHFSGHGQETGELCFENEHGETAAVSADAITRLFELASEFVECVVLNACYSSVQAEAMQECVDYVVGMHDPIGDRAAILFATGFYRAVCSGLTIDKAFRYGLTELALNNCERDLKASLYGRKGSTSNQTVLPPPIEPDVEMSREAAKACLTVVIDKDIKDFTSSEQMLLVLAMSQVAGISPEQVKIARISAGSVYVDLYLPKDAVARIAESCESDSELCFRALSIKQIIIIDGHKRRIIRLGISVKNNRVKWFDEKKGYGFITNNSEEDVADHYDHTMVRGRITKGGYVKWFDEKMGYGLITLDSGKDLFVELGAIVGKSGSKLGEGARVQIDVGKLSKESVDRLDDRIKK